MSYFTMDPVVNGQKKQQIVKVGDTQPIGTIVDYDGSSVPNGWEEVDDPNEYSTTETKIGTWIDGKPIYRKVIDYLPTEIIGQAGATTNISIPHNISNLKQVVNVRSITETNHPFPSFASSSGTTLTAGNTVTQITATNINFRIINDNWSARHFYFILEYTKTTD